VASYTRVKYEEISLKKPEIDYPCVWSYKVIASDRELVTQAVLTVLEDFEYQFSESNQSRTGKYVSFNISARVASEEERNELFCILQNVPTVKMVL
jgi:putative lipoic acid-binding regulatory protein